MVEKICHLKLKINVYLKYTEIWNKKYKIKKCQYKTKKKRVSEFY